MTVLLGPVAPPESVPRQRILTKSVLALMGVSLGALSNFYLLFPVVPMLAVRLGAGAAFAGIAAGLLMFFTVVVEPITPYLTRRFGVRRVLAAGLLLLGVPAFMPALFPSIGMLLLSCALRGAGIGIILVSETALLATLLPPERRGEGIGLYGVVIGVPSLLFLPFGVGVTEAMGPTLVFAVGGGLALLPLAAVAVLPRRGASAPAAPQSARIDTVGLARLALPFAATTIAIGVVSAFLPIAVAVPDVAVAALFAQSCATPLSRWAAGKLAHLIPAGRLITAGLLLSAVGMSALVFVGTSAMVVVGMAIFGIGFGGAQYASLTLLLDRTGPDGYDRASAVWNLAYDGGMGVGSGGFGILANTVGFPAGFAITAAILLAAVVGTCRRRPGR